MKNAGPWRAGSGRAAVKGTVSVALVAKALPTLPPSGPSVGHRPSHPENPDISEGCI